MQERTFYVTDLRQVRHLYRAWTTTFPFIKPFYAVKCNPDPNIVGELARLGASFDCASLNEMKMLFTKYGMSSDRIIFANPAKIPQHISYARENNVHRTTFDSIAELEKLKQWHPEAECLLRFRVDNAQAKCNLGAKYGATPEEIPGLLETAKKLNMPIVGVAFHIGSGGRTYDQALKTAMSSAARILSDAKSYGVLTAKAPPIVDIGGGYTPDYDSSQPGGICMKRLQQDILGNLYTSFPDAKHPTLGPITFIAEPGRFFAESSVSIYTPIYSKRVRDGKQECWIMEGMYGAFNCMIYDHQFPTYVTLRSPRLPSSFPLAEDQQEQNQDLKPTMLWGPTCDSFDRVYEDAQLPDLRIGDWLMFPNAGAYTLAGACDFNGIAFTRPQKYVIR